MQAPVPLHVPAVNWQYIVFAASTDVDALSDRQSESLEHAPCSGGQAGNSQLGGTRET